MRIHNIYYHGELVKIIPELSSNPPQYQVLSSTDALANPIWVVLFTYARFNYTAVVLWLYKLSSRLEGVSI